MRRELASEQTCYGENGLFRSGFPVSLTFVKLNHPRQTNQVYSGCHFRKGDSRLWRKSTY
jgi:hypothetical protein